MMPVIRLYLDDDIFRCLKVAAVMDGRDVEALANAAVSEAANRALPCINGRPTQARHDAIWDKVNAHISPPQN